MDRRDAIKRVALIMGGTLSASTLAVVMDGCKTGNKDTSNSFSQKEVDMIGTISEIIIPPTDTPGAKEVGVPAFITLMIQDCYPAEKKEEFLTGLNNFDAYCKDQFGKNFLKLTGEKQEDAVGQMDRIVLGKKGSEQDKDSKLKKDFSFYRMLKELTLLGFFTSEPGATKALRYIQIPGKYEGCLPYKEGEKAWAT